MSFSPFSTFFIIRDVFVFKIGMNIFSRLTYSIELFKSYETIYFPNLKNISHLRYARAHYSWDIIFCLLDEYLANFGQKKYIWVKMNIIFGISINKAEKLGFKSEYIVCTAKSENIWWSFELSCFSGFSPYFPHSRSGTYLEGSP
jgi:hypothetical protein